MANYSPNLNLELPLQTEFYDIDKFNANFGKLSEIASRPNLVDNPDFSNPINQRAITTQNGVTSGTAPYVIDRWQTGYGSGSFTVNSGYVTLSGKGSRLHIRQYFEHYQQMFGKTYTLSFKYRVNGVGGGVYVCSEFASGGYLHLMIDSELIADGEWHVMRKTFTMTQRGSEVKTYISCGIGTMNESASWVINSSTSVIDFEWMKLEEGTESSVFVKPDHATELLKCKRFFIRFNEAIFPIYTYNGNGIWFACAIEAQMRANPSITIRNAMLTSGNGATTQSGWNIYVETGAGVTNFGRTRWTTTALKSNTFNFTSGVKLHASYDLTADL